MTASTLRDYILDHRCPNCGTTMEKRPKPAWRWRDTLEVVAVTLLIIGSTLEGPVSHEWSHATWSVAVAILIVVSGRWPS